MSSLLINRGRSVSILLPLQIHSLPPSKVHRVPDRLLMCRGIDCWTQGTCSTQLRLPNDFRSNMQDPVGRTLSDIRKKFLWNALHHQELAETCVRVTVVTDSRCYSTFVLSFGHIGAVDTLNRLRLVPSIVSSSPELKILLIFPTWTNEACCVIHVPFLHLNGDLSPAVFDVSNNW